MDKQYFIDGRNVAWREFLEALNSGNYTLTTCTDTEEYLVLGNAALEIAKLKRRLLDTDYQAIKYAEGRLTEEEYTEMKARRQAWRDRINELEQGG